MGPCVWTGTQNNGLGTQNNLTTYFREGHKEEPSADASSCSFLHMATSRVLEYKPGFSVGALFTWPHVRTARMGPGRPVPGQVGRMGGDLAVGGAPSTARSASSPATVLASCPVYHGPLTAYYFRPSNPQAAHTHNQNTVLKLVPSF